MLVLDALICPAFILTFHDTADQLIILLQEPLDRLLIDFRLASQPVRYEGHRHPGKPGCNTALGPTDLCEPKPEPASSSRRATATARTHDRVGLWHRIQAGKRLCSLVCLSRASSPATAEPTPRACRAVTRNFPVSTRQSRPESRQESVLNREVSSYLWT